MTDLRPPHSLKIGDQVTTPRGQVATVVAVESANVKVQFDTGIFKRFPMSAVKKVSDGDRPEEMN